MSPPSQSQFLFLFAGQSVLALADQCSNSPLAECKTDGPVRVTVRLNPNVRRTIFNSPDNSKAMNASRPQRIGTDKPSARIVYQYRRLRAGSSAVFCLWILTIISF